MKKPVIFVLLGLLAIIAVLAGIKALQIRAMIAAGKKFVPPPETVTTAAVRQETWNTTIASVGTLTAVQGVTIAAELAGKVVKIAFESGTRVNRGDILIAQDTTSEEAQLPGALAQVDLARVNLKRASQMLADKIIAQADFDTAKASYDQAVSQADTIKAAIAKKKIHAPFSGRLGIRQINLGQILREADPIVQLESLDPILVDFSLPQQQLGLLKKGLPVHLLSDAYPGLTMEGRITAINPLIDADTRNIKVQATITNKEEKLRPGMFVNVSVGIPTSRKVLVIPATAVLYAPYSDSVFVVEDAKEGKGKVLRQQIVRLGEKRGDFVAVATGLKDGETVVSTGVFKLRNGQAAVIDNKLAPEFKLHPKPENN